MSGPTAQNATPTSMDLTKLELEARATARKQVANLLQVRV